MGKDFVTENKPLPTTAASRREPVKVLYVSGFGRSGSTLLDIGLGMHPDVFGAGEVGNLTRHVLQNDEFCACGQRVSECELWRDILAHWRDGEAPDLVERYHRLQKRIERVLTPSFLALSSSMIPGFDEYAAHTQRLMGCIQQVTGKSVIVDSSKLASRALALSMLPGIDLRLVHLIRDPRGVAWSMLQSFQRDESLGLQKELRPKPPVRTGLLWLLFNGLSEISAWRLGRTRHYRLRYEDFVADPLDTLDRVGALFGLRYSDVLPAEAALELVPGHQVAGSRIRMKPLLQISHEQSWKMKMDDAAKRRVSRTTRVFMSRYGYSSRAHETPPPRPSLPLPAVHSRRDPPAWSDIRSLRSCNVLASDSGLS